jgi:hypothetical protein
MVVGDSRVPSPCRMGEGQRRRRRNWVRAADGLSGVIEDDMSGRNGQRKHGTTRGSPRRSRTAKAPRITGFAGKSRRAHEWGAWGRVSEDGPGHYNPDRSEGPWGRAAKAARMAVSNRVTCPTQSGVPGLTTADTNDGCQPYDGTGMPGAGLTETPSGKAPPERPALKPYWGKPAVRNFRGGRWKRRHHSKPGPRHRPTRLQSRKN